MASMMINRRDFLTLHQWSSLMLLHINYLYGYILADAYQESLKKNIT